MVPNPIINYLTENHHIHIQHSVPIGGGCIHNATKIKTTQQTYFLKWNNKHQFANFEAEVKGLTHIQKTNTIPTPKLLEIGKADHYSFLLLEFIDSSSAAPDFWEDFGTRLALLHKHTHNYFGLSYNNFIGALPQINTPQTSWPTFFSEIRIKPLLTKAHQSRLISSSLVQQVEALLIKLTQWFPDEPPALIHGDLWGGNWMSNAQGKVMVFDPAIYFAHREIELAFMQLFDRIPESFFRSYHEEYPLASGWQERMELYHLYPLLVHVILFGGSYVTGIKNIVSKYG